ncbi:unnamed protein product [Ectocarpus sp. 4 AP-2014]
MSILVGVFLSFFLLHDDGLYAMLDVSATECCLGMPFVLSLRYGEGSRARFLGTSHEVLISYLEENSLSHFFMVDLNSSLSGRKLLLPNTCEEFLFPYIVINSRLGVWQSSPLEGHKGKTLPLFLDTYFNIWCLAE